MALRTYYKEAKERQVENDFTKAIVLILQQSPQTYGTRRVKVELQQQDLMVSRLLIGQIMKEQGLVSSYTVAQFKSKDSQFHESSLSNTLNHSF
ncbi:IS3 family transposase [Priestia endophytica]|uniref:IS3 family transposase n=1 Tax=Priestia endophytica TaxID=135735 RepID=UPI000F52C48D